MRLLAEAAERKQLELVCEIDSSVPCVVSGDAGRLRQILLNLLGNATKFTEIGEVAIRASQVQRNGSTARLRFEISDTGIGIAEDARKNLFQAFVQVDGSTTRKHEGTGLGLAISKQLVLLMGGQIGFDSAVGVGSTFWFEIPLEVISDLDESSRIQWDALRGLRILIVDDNSTNRTVMLRTVESWGMSAEQAPDGRHALKVLESASERDQPFDIALLDLQMPQMDGIQLARNIRARAPSIHPALDVDVFGAKDRVQFAQACRHRCLYGEACEARALIPDDREALAEEYSWSKQQRSRALR